MHPFFSRRTEQERILREFESLFGGKKQKTKYNERQKKILDVFGFSYYKNNDGTIQKVCNFDDFDFTKTPFPKSQAFSRVEFDKFCKEIDIAIKI